MERTQTDIVCSAAFQAHEVAYHIDNIGCIENFLYCFAIDFFHSTKLVKNSIREVLTNLPFLTHST